MSDSQEFSSIEDENERQEGNFDTSNDFVKKQDNSKKNKLKALKKDNMNPSITDEISYP